MSHSLDKRIWFTIIFLLLKKSLTLFQIWIFFHTFTYFFPFRVIENRVTKIILSILMKVVTIAVVLVDQFYSYMHKPVKDWLFEKNYFRARLSLS